MRISTFISTLFFSYITTCVASTSSPIVTVQNGTIKGLHSEEWNQDLFLGIPYAQPPVGDLRFRWPRSINTTWNSPLDATRYGYSCYQYNSNFNMSEDCLTVNGTHSYFSAGFFSHTNYSKSYDRQATKIKHFQSSSGSTVVVGSFFPLTPNTISSD